MTFLTRHRTICAVLQEIGIIALDRADGETTTLCCEAIRYARSMSAALVAYKKQLEAAGITPDKEFKG